MKELSSPAMKQPLEAPETSILSTFDCSIVTDWFIESEQVAFFTTKLTLYVPVVRFVIGAGFFPVTVCQPGVLPW